MTMSTVEQKNWATDGLVLPPGGPGLSVGV